MVLCAGICAVECVRGPCMCANVRLGYMDGLGCEICCVLENVLGKVIGGVYVLDEVLGTSGVRSEKLIEGSDVSRFPGWRLEQESWMRASVRLVTYTM